MNELTAPTVENLTTLQDSLSGTALGFFVLGVLFVASLAPLALAIESRNALVTIVVICLLLTAGMTTFLLPMTTNGGAFVWLALLPIGGVIWFAALVVGAVSHAAHMVSMSSQSRRPVVSPAFREPGSAQRRGQ